MLHEPLRRRDAAAVAIASRRDGTLLRGKFGPGSRGDLVGLLSGVFFAVLILSLRRERDAGAVAAVTYGNALTAVLLLPFVRQDLALSGRSAVILLFLGVFQLAAAYALFVKGIRHVPATQAAILGMIEPIANPIWVFLFMGERPSSALPLRRRGGSGRHRVADSVNRAASCAGLRPTEPPPLSF